MDAVWSLTESIVVGLEPYSEVTVLRDNIKQALRDLRRLVATELGTLGTETVILRIARRFLEDYLLDVIDIYNGVKAIGVFVISIKCRAVLDLLQKADRPITCNYGCGLLMSQPPPLDQNAVVIYWFYGKRTFATMVSLYNHNTGMFDFGNSINKKVLGANTEKCWASGKETYRLRFSNANINGLPLTIMNCINDEIGTAVAEVY